MILKSKLTWILGALLLSALAANQAQAASMTFTGTLGNDSSVFTQLLSLSGSVIISSDSYGGGTNLNGTTAAAGGFVPNITLFSASTGNVVAFDGGDGLAGGCRGGAKMDSATHLCDDAYIMTTLAAGNYILDVSEFPNVANGNYNTNPQFFFSSALGGDPSATGDDLCGNPGGMFLQSDVAPCVQRNANFSVNIGSVPEPATFWLAIPVLALGLLRRKRANSRP